MRKVVFVPPFSATPSSKLWHSFVDDNLDGKRPQHRRFQIGKVVTLRKSNIGNGKSWIFWLVVEPTHLENISQIGHFPQIGVKNKNI